MLILKFTIDDVTDRGIEPEVLTSTLSIRDASVLTEGVQALCADVLASLDDDHADEPSDGEVAPRDERDVAATDAGLSMLTAHELLRLRMTVDNFDSRARRELFDPVRDADDLHLLMPVLRKLLATHIS